ncbi:nucleoside 2-deoxyribosyltransferase [Methanolapillus ohkumae]|uniref:Nucleoside 2-deoxyribosyltransferase n=1 Tax=Methanolapillus ohkumae TaxID=3028298 RepID=A0AA96VEJ2_9EURY|nr:hypothetical protein MsAm2_06470 [Methanosarcinaceae archaeon Am2]
MKTIYLAGPLFSEAEREFNKKLAAELKNLGFAVFLPQEDAEDDSVQRHNQNQSGIFQSCFSGLEKSDLIVAILEGADIDSGTAWELGYAYAAKKPIIGLRTDFRIHTPNEKVNLMIQETLDEFVLNLRDLMTVLKEYV